MRPCTMKTRALGIIAAAGLSACATAKPTPQLVQARESYSEAAKSDARQVAPDRLLEAKQALDRAEAAHKKNPGSEAEKHYAYMAERTAELAVAHGNYAMAYKERQQAERQLHALQEQYRKQAENRLETAQRELDETRESLQRVRGEVDAEGQARQAAEATAQAAVESLKEVAMVKEEARGTTITLSGAVLFATGQSDLLPIAKQTLDKVAEALKQQPEDKTILIEGYTDSRGSAQMNLELSRKRAESVRDYLVSDGVSASRLEVVGKGETHPVASNDTPEGRANNRRVEIVIQDNR